MRLRQTARLMPAWLRAPLSHLRSRLFDIYAVKSYSQEGEDMILQRMFAGSASGFYVDVGAHHPRRFSNTYLFYRRGWRGINIEPNPDAIKMFESDRKGDTNIQMGIASRPGTLAYYMFDEPALNTFDERMVQSRLATTSYRVAGKVSVPVDRLDNVLKKYLPSGVRIDFLSVDVEGFDYEVLQSNDWQLFRPQCVVVEALRESVEGAMTGETACFLKGHGYELVAKTFNSLVFREGPRNTQAER